MKHGFIFPIAYLEYTTKSDFHLILPHLVEKYPAYKEFYKERAKQGDHILLDNSIFEHEVSFDYKKMLEYAEEIGVKEMSAPEVLKDREQSKKLRDEFLDFYAKSGGKVDILAVAQGRTCEEVVQSFFELQNISEIAALGLPFDLDDHNTTIKSTTLRRVFNRWSVVSTIDNYKDFVISINNGAGIKPTHLMGLSDPLELQAYGNNRFPWIRSNDSSSAFVHGFNLIKLTDRGLPGEKISQKLDFNGYQNISLTEEQISAIEHNMSTILNWIK